MHNINIFLLEIQHESCMRAPPVLLSLGLHLPPRTKMISVKCTAADVADPNFGFLYCPSFPAAVLFAALFGLTTILHVIQAIYYRKKFCWVLIMAGTWETGGLCLRVLSVLHPRSEAFGTPSQLLILLAPIWINAFDYVVMTLGSKAKPKNPQLTCPGFSLDFSNFPTMYLKNLDPGHHQDIS
ncbi:hypothetical protein C8J57DRAFT_1584124 [Mycena rebaudengoi]|nr:hypothetical protein C8J57DRAFT_1584124 [Mycena rebaudengoi]